MAKKTRQILRRIRNVRHVRQITHAMYTIASTQVLQRKKALLSARPFGAGVREALAALVAAARSQGISHPLLEPGQGEGIGVLVVSADRGLCGRYILELNQAAARFAAEHPTAIFLGVGNKTVRFLRRRGLPLAREYVRAYARPSVGCARKLLGDILSLFYG